MKVLCIKPDDIYWDQHSGPEFGDESEVVKIVKGISTVTGKAIVGYHFFEWPWEMYPVPYNAEYFVQIDTQIDEVTIAMTNGEWCL